MLRAISNSFQKSLKGEERLWIVFWGWFIALLLACWTINLLLTPLIIQFNKFLLAPYPILYLNLTMVVVVTLTLAFRAFIIFVVWKCAPNTTHSIWRHIARTIIVLFALLTVYGTMRTAMHTIIIYNEIKNYKPLVN